MGPLDDYLTIKLPFSYCSEDEKLDDAVILTGADFADFSDGDGNILFRFSFEQLQVIYRTMQDQRAIRLKSNNV